MDDKRKYKILYVEQAGTERAGYGDGGDNMGDVGSNRIRAAFSLNNGKRVYFDAESWRPTQEQAQEWNAKCSQGDKLTAGALYIGALSLHYISDNVEENGVKIKPPRNAIAWTREDIRRFINSLGANFSAIVYIPKFPFYAAHAVGIEAARHGNVKCYNYGDEFDTSELRAEIRAFCAQFDSPNKPKQRDVRDDIAYFDTRAYAALSRAARLKYDMMEALDTARLRVERVAAGKSHIDADPSPELAKLIAGAFDIDPTGAGWWDWLTRRTAEGGEYDKKNT